MMEAAQSTHGDDSAGDGALLTGPQDNCVTEAHGTVRSRGRRQGRPLENRVVRTTDASAWPGCSRGVAPEGGRTHIPARGDLPLTTQTYASWNLEGYCRSISHGGIPPRSRGGGGQAGDCNRVTLFVNVISWIMNRHRPPRVAPHAVLDGALLRLPHRPVALRCDSGSDGPSGTLCLRRLPHLHGSARGPSWS